MQSIDEAKATFLDRELLLLTASATAQRSKLYARGLSEAERGPFQASLRAALRELASSRPAHLSDEEHLADIERLAAQMSTRHAPLLRDGRMRLGHAQKALNFFLKYLWCIGRGPEPPHFPVDSIMLRAIPGFRSYRWTTMDSGSDYLDIVRTARGEAERHHMSLAAWELVCYSRRRKT